MILIDRKSLRYLLCFVSKTKLAQEFGISIPTFRKYLHGEEPKSIGITEKINREITKLRESTRKVPTVEHPHPEWRKP